MKGVQVYHTIQVLQNAGFSYREIADILGISKTTVGKYLNIPISCIDPVLMKVKRKSVLDPYREDFKNQLEAKPNIRSSRLYRDFCKQHPEIDISGRGFRKYIQKLKAEIQHHRIRYFQPVVYQPGQQIQVDIGEQRVEKITGGFFKVYFVAFSLSFSRMKYVYFQNRPFQTNDFIRAHKSCFSYFGYIPAELVYDQTKLVVIQEKYREVWFNHEFWQFANRVGFSPYVCEGYDPQSKGLIERAIREVKEDFLYGRIFIDIEDVRQQSLDWLLDINSRVHHTTQKRPVDLFEEEKKLMKPYIEDKREIRKVDKVGLISWQGSRYSVPYLFQRKEVLVSADDIRLYVFAKNQSKPIAVHSLSHEKGKLVMNNNHYRDYGESLSDLRNKAEKLVSEIEGGKEFIERLISDNPRHGRDQLRGVIKLYKKYSDADWKQVFKDLLPHQTMRASLLESKLSDDSFYKHVKPNKTKKPEISSIQRPLSYYEEIIYHG